jgi:hypothetical protein
MESHNGLQGKLECSRLTAAAMTFLTWIKENLWRESGGERERMRNMNIREDLEI